MHTSTLLPFLLLLLLPHLLATARSSPTPTPTVYDILPTFGLPAGLLPDTVKSYALSDDGAFVVELESACYVQFDYLVYYEQTITGTLKVGGIHDLNGVQVKKFFLWLDVDEIKVDLPPNKYIYFEIGWISKKLEVDQFRTVHSCDDGVGCGKARSRFFQLPEPVMEATMLLTE